MPSPCRQKSSKHSDNQSGKKRLVSHSALFKDGDAASFTVIFSEKKMVGFMLPEGYGYVVLTGNL